jgi:hypothetical protein
MLDACSNNISYYFTDDAADDKLTLDTAAANGMAML